MSASKFAWSCGSTARALYLVACVVGPFSGAAADTVKEFYMDKTISMVVSSSPGGGYDTLARTVSRHLQKHLPGATSIVVRNMPGAGGMRAMNYLYSSAAQDGTVMGAVNNITPLQPLFGAKGAEFDATKFNWLGTPSVETGLLFVWHTSPFKTINDVQQRELTAGANGLVSTPALYSRLLNEVLGTKIKVIIGYPGQNEAYLAIERGEIDAYGVTFWSSLTSTKQQWLDENKIRILLQYGPIKEPDLKDVPYGPDLVKNEEDRLLFRTAYGPLSLGRPYLMPPNVLADRVKAVQSAFMRTMGDQEFQQEAEKIGLKIGNPRSGEELREEIEQLYKTPKHILERLQRIATGK